MPAFHCYQGGSTPAKMQQSRKEPAHMCNTYVTRSPKQGALCSTYVSTSHSIHSCWGHSTWSSLCNKPHASQTPIQGCSSYSQLCIADVLNTTQATDLGSRGGGQATLSCGRRHGTQPAKHAQLLLPPLARWCAYAARTASVIATTPMLRAHSCC